MLPDTRLILSVNKILITILPGLIRFVLVGLVKQDS